MHRTRFGVLVPIVVVLAACGLGSGTPGPDPSPTPDLTPPPAESPAPATPSAPPPSAPGGVVDATGAWRLVEGSLDGAPIALVEGADITFEVDGSGVSGRAACNQYFGEFVVQDGVVRLGGLGQTEMACDEPIMAAEGAYLHALGRVTAARMDGDILVLLGEGVELRFERLEPPPTAELVGTTWLLDGLVSGDVVASTIGDPATLELDDDGTFRATTGCRALAGRYVLREAMVEVTEMAAEGECAGGPADQDQHVLAVLEGGFLVAIDGRTLRLAGDGGRGLVYRVAEVR